MAQLAVIVGLLIVAISVNVGKATHAYCESILCPGRCRDNCLPGEVASSNSQENWGCKHSSDRGYVDYCCKVKVDLTSIDIESASSSTNLPGHPAENAFDGSLSTKWKPQPNAALPQWVKATLETVVCTDILEATITRGANRNIKEFQLIFDSGNSPVFTWPKSEGVTKTVSVTGVKTKTIKIVIHEKFHHPGTITIKEVSLSTP